MNKRKGLSPIIATIILSATVLIIGGGVWSYSIGAATIVAEDYTDKTFSTLNEVIERFCIEHIYYDNVTDQFFVWVYNYGSVDVTIDVYVNIIEDSIQLGPQNLIISSQSHGKVQFDDQVLDGKVVEIKLYSWRQNMEVVSYEVP